MRFRKKPIEIDAWVWEPDDPFRAGQLIGLVSREHEDFPRVGDDKSLVFYCVKSKAWCEIAAGDWVIRETDGIGFYPCSAEMFAMSFDPVLVSGTSMQSVRQGSSLHIGTCPRSDPDPNLPADVPCRCGPQLPIEAS